jgi:hypothetical protein
MSTNETPHEKVVGVYWELGVYFPCPSSGTHETDRQLRRNGTGSSSLLRHLAAGHSTRTRLAGSHSQASPGLRTPQTLRD